MYREKKTQRLMESVYPSMTQNQDINIKKLKQKSKKMALSFLSLWAVNVTPRHPTPNQNFQITAS